MEVKIVENSNKNIVRRETRMLLKQGWKPATDEIQELIKYIPYKVMTIKKYPSKTYYQELTKENVL